MKSQHSKLSAVTVLDFSALLYYSSVSIANFVHEFEFEYEKLTV